MERGLWAYSSVLHYAPLGVNRLYALDALPHSQAAFHSENQAPVEDYFQAMTDEEINQAIAAHVGSKLTKFYDWSGPGTGSWVQWPNYCVDLNEMHKVEKTLDAVKKRKYETHFGRDIQGQEHPYTLRENDGIFATAHQRAEAFLRTVGKWIE